MATLSNEKQLCRSYTRHLTGATGTQQIPVPGASLDASSRIPCRYWQLQLAVSGNPTAGTLTVHGKAPGTDEFVALDGNIDMTSGRIVQFEGVFEVISVDPDDFNGDSYSIYLFAAAY